MPATMIPIQSITLTGSAASVTFSGIPQTYTDLVFRYSARCDAAVSFRLGYIELNSVTSSYSMTYLLGNGGAAVTSRAASQPFVGYIQVNGTSSTSNTFTSGEFYIPNYTASQSKPMSLIDVAETNATTANIMAEAALWQNTSAISSIKFALDGSGSLVAGSTFHLYGIKAT